MFVGFFRRVAAGIVVLVPLAGCAPSVSLRPSPIPANSTTLLVRLGADTLAVEQYTRTPSRMEGVLVQRTPVATIAHYSVELGENNAPMLANFSLRRADGTIGQGTMQSLSVRFGTDSVTFIGHRVAGDTTRRMAARGEFLPFVNGSYGLFELALNKLRASGRDSAEFTIVPLNFNVTGTRPVAIKLTGGDAARITWFGNPLHARYDARGSVLGVDGSQTTVKVRVDRVAAIDLDTLGRTWAARDQVAGPAGPASTRDTVRATIGTAQLWIDYGRPALRGRNVWVNGVLGDTIWRTGANAATQLRTDADIMIGGMPVPAGTYSLWTWASRNGYHLIVNKQAGQWGTDYHAERDLVRVPLREMTKPGSPAERFTIGIDPQDGSNGVITFTWGSTQLSVPVSPK